MTLNDITAVFRDGKMELDFDSRVSGREAIAQGALLNVVNRSGTNRDRPSQGTDLLKDSLSGGASTLLDATHISNFAAMLTQLLLKSEQDPESGPDHLVSRVKLQPVEFSNQRLRLNLSVTFEDGSSVGVEREI